MQHRRCDTDGWCRTAAAFAVMLGEERQQVAGEITQGCLVAQLFSLSNYVVTPKRAKRCGSGILYLRPVRLFFEP